MKLITGSPQSLHSFVMTTTQPSLRSPRRNVAVQWIILCFVLSLSINVCAGEEPVKTPVKDPANDIQIKADNMRYDTSHKHADASGNARLSYKVKDSLVTLKSNELHAEFDDKGNLTEAIAEGNVEIEYDATKLYATKCVHHFDTNVAVCTGEDVHLIQEKNEVHGKEATLDIGTHVFTMQASQEDQVTCVVYPKQKEDKQ